MGNRGIERRLIPYCAKRRIAVVGYSPFGHVGFQSLQGKGRQVLSEIGKRHDKTAAQVMLNFLTRHPNTFSIPKARRIEHVKENSESVGGWELTVSDLAEIEEAFPLSTVDEPLEMI